MNDIEKAIDTIVGISNDYENKSEQDIALSMAVAVLEKQIPKSPKNETHIYGEDADGNRGIELTDLVCPNCENDIVLDSEYCPDCGQHLLREPSVPFNN